MDALERLTRLFERFPGIGPRQAKRFVHYLLATPAGVRVELADLIKKLGAETRQCVRCFRWFVKPASTRDDSTRGGNGSSTELCSICSDTRREEATLFVVEKDADIESVERSGFRGLYFVLGGTLPLPSDEPEKHIRIQGLQKRLAEGKVKEVILGLSATTEGDHTRSYLQETLSESGVKITSLGRGLSTGSELEYADPDTIASALESRN